MCLNYLNYFRWRHLRVLVDFEQPKWILATEMSRDRGSIHEFFLFFFRKSRNASVKPSPFRISDGVGNVLVLETRYE